MELKLDSDVQAVAEYMQDKIAAGKLVAVAEQLPQLARLLWSQFPQEPCAGASLVLPKTLDRENQSQAVST